MSKKMRWYLLMMVWIACGVFNYGKTFAHFQNENSDSLNGNRAMAAWMATAGPIATPVVIIMTEWLYPQEGQTSTWRLR